MLRLGFCHDKVSLSQAMDLYCFVYTFAICSLINDYNDVLVILSDFKWVFKWKKYEKAKSVSTENDRKKGDFEIKLVMIGPLKTYELR